MSDYPMLISNKLHSFRNFARQRYKKYSYINPYYIKRKDKYRTVSNYFAYIRIYI